MVSITNLINIFTKLSERRDKSNEIGIMIKEELNNLFNYDKFDYIKCDRVFVSEGNGSDKYYVSVIPRKPESGVLTTKFIKSYDIDIDLSSFTNDHDKTGFSPEEMVVWMLHELICNVFTDETFLRFKKLLVKYYDIKNQSVLNTIDSYGMMLWIGIFSRTKKYFSNDNTTPVNIMMNKFKINKVWDSSLKKYVASSGGDISILTDEYINRMDKIQLRKFNELARKYSSYTLKYNNTDYSTMIKYVINTSKSDLLAHYLMAEPASVPTHSEKIVHTLFDDNKLLLETTSDDTVELIEEISVNDLLKKYDNVKTDIDTIKSQSDKLLCSAKLKELSILVDDKYQDDISSEILQKLKYDIEDLMNKLKDTEVSEEISMIELEG